ncbi:MAG: Yip1 family protein [Pseudomonadota bacterium]
MSMPFATALKIAFTPQPGWQSAGSEPPSFGTVLLTQTIPMALLPTICWYIGTTQIGWQVGDQTMRLTAESGLALCALFFLAMIFGVMFLGFMVRWMSTAYGREGDFSTGFTLISYTATPFFLAGVLGLFPVLWLDILVGTAIACYCIYLLYIGVSPMMKVTPDRGFLYASAVFAVALVSFVALLGVTAILWEYGPAPEYRY